MSPTKLVNILTEAGVEMTRVKPGRRSHPNADDSALHRRVRTEDIERAIRKREATESVAEGARRIGVNSDTLHKWLHEAGLSRGTSVPWRVERELVDEILAERLTRPTSRCPKRAREAA
jgi:transposase-like protein